MTTNQDPFYIPPSGNVMDLLWDEEWQRQTDEAETPPQDCGCILAGQVKAVGWMKTWPELFTYLHYDRLRSLVFRGFAALLLDEDRGDDYEAALAFGKPLVMERLTLPTAEIKAQLLALVETELFGFPVELTPDRLAVLRSVFREVLTQEDWLAIGQAGQRQIVMAAPIAS
jgi:hypothetical protein